MPSPIGHSLMGYIIYRAATKLVEVHRWMLALLYILAANAPDLDFIPGFLIGDPNRYHHGISHSLGFAVLFAAASSLMFWWIRRDVFGKHFAIFLCLYCSHLFLDYLSIDTSFPYGIPLFWPVTTAYYIASFAFLPDINRVSSSSIDFIASLFSFHNLCAVTVEFLILLPFIVLVLLLKNGRMGRRRPLSSYQP